MINNKNPFEQLVENQNTIHKNSQKNPTVGNPTVVSYLHNFFCFNIISTQNKTV